MSAGTCGGGSPPPAAAVAWGGSTPLEPIICGAAATGGVYPPLTGAAAAAAGGVYPPPANSLRCCSSQLSVGLQLLRQGGVYPPPTPRAAAAAKGEPPPPNCCSVVRVDLYETFYKRTRGYYYVVSRKHNFNLLECHFHNKQKAPESAATRNACLFSENTLFRKGLRTNC